MSMILIIGEYSDGTAELSQALSQDFDTQLCSANSKIVRVMAKKCQPDLALIDHSLASTEITEELKAYSDSLPQVLFNLADSNKAVDLVYKTLGIARADQGQQPTEKKHILVVDDNAIMLRNIRNMLMEEYRVSMAPSAQDCMEIMAIDQPNLIILDYEMPETNGRQILEMLRANENYKDIPVIFLTGFADKEHVDAVLSLKPAGYFVKPPVQLKLLNALKGLLDK